MSTMPFHLESLWGARLMPHGVRWMGQNELVRVGKNFGPVSSLCGLKFMKFWDSVGDSSYLPTPLPDCLCHVLFRRYLPLSIEVVENRTNVNVSWPLFFPVERPQLFYSRLLARFTVRSLAKFGWVLFADLAMKQNAEFT